MNLCVYLFTKPLIIKAMTYKVYFEIYGKKKFIRIEAKNEEEARKQTINLVSMAVVIHKVKRDVDPEVERIMNIFGMKP